ncbi:poly-gamma-glutamate system protein [bacterium]|nr:poly-gamma-glutamate system protein [bacterium]MBU1881520.1 poly-gamma-glutamate system protein [bacterium]
MKSRRTLALLMVLAAVLFYWAEGSRMQVKQPFYELKIEAAQKMVTALDAVRLNRLEAGWALDEVNDPYQSALVGLQYSIITTDEGDLGAKLTTINPNFSAVVLQMLKDAGVGEGDKVAIGATGSFPALNIAAIIACEVIGAEPALITSVGASMWGANNPDFTYLDIEHLLYEKQIIKHRSLAASIGGGDDIGRSISQAGRIAIIDAVRRNDIPYIDADSQTASQQQRRAVYHQFSGGEAYKVFINIGGGIAVLGHPANADLIPSGLNKTYLQMNYPGRGLIHEFWERGIPVMNFVNVNHIASEYGLPQSPVPLPPVGAGAIFSVERYNLNVAWIAVVILFAALILVLILDKEKHKLWKHGVEPDTLL